VEAAAAPSRRGVGCNAAKASSSEQCTEKKVQLETHTLQEVFIVRAGEKIFN
jgi:hypothetical protein